MAWRKLTIELKMMNGVFDTRREFHSFLVLSLFILAFYISIPVIFIPGNSLGFFLSTEPLWGIALLVILAMEVSFVLTKRVFVALRKKKASNKGIIKDATAVAGSILPNILTCPILAVTFLSFLLPVTSIWALVGYRWYVFGIFTILMGVIVFRKIRTQKISLASSV